MASLLPVVTAAQVRYSGNLRVTLDKSRYGNGTSTRTAAQPRNDVID